MSIEIIPLTIKYVNIATLSNKMCENVGYVWDIVGNDQTLKYRCKVVRIAHVIAILGVQNQLKLQGCHKRIEQD